jgi:hypothetical protein
LYVLVISEPEECMPRSQILIAALMAAFVIPHAAIAQTKKEKAERAAAKQQPEVATKSSGWPPCAGGVFWSDRNSQCSLPDGRTCTVIVQGSGRADLTDCRR